MYIVLEVIQAIFTIAIFITILVKSNKKQY